MNQDIVIWQPGTTLEQMERKIIVAAFKFYRSNKTMTAQSLGIAIRTLDNKLQAYESNERPKTPTRQEIHDEIQKDLTKTGEGGHDPRGQQKTIADAEHFASGKTGPGGRMSEEELDRLNAAKQARMEKASGVLQNGEQTGHGAEEGVRLQSTSEVSSEPAVSLSEREEVQEVSSELVAKNGIKQRSGNLQTGNEGRSNQVHGKQASRGAR